MASVAFDPKAKTYLVRFRFAGREFKRSLSTCDRKSAYAALARAEETLMLVANGRLEMPADADPAVFILSDGKQTECRQSARISTLGELCANFQAARVPGAKEESTVRTEDLHIRHLLRLLKQSSFVQSLRTADLQVYVTRRLAEKCRGRTIAAETVRKELATLRVIWNWAIRQDYLERQAPVLGLEYPKRDERHPFRTWEEILEIIARGGLTASEQTELWESLYLTREEVQDVLQFVESVARHAFIYPLFVLVAHTGVRISEALRSRIEDIDFKAGKILVREKKRSRVRATTFRRVEMTRMLAQVMREWLRIHPGGLYTFSKPDDLNRGRQAQSVVSINKHVARKHFTLTFRGSKWAKLRGFHVFRHSFASNLASQGVDQRIIDEWMGHQTEEMRARYRHLLPDVQRQAIQRLMP